MMKRNPKEQSIFLHNTIFEDKDGWYHWDEVFCNSYGPYKTELEAMFKCDCYFLMEVEGPHKAARQRFLNKGKYMKDLQRREAFLRKVERKCQTNKSLMKCWRSTENELDLYVPLKSKELILDFTELEKHPRLY